MGVQKVEGFGMNASNRIKADYSIGVDEFIKRGGQIQSAVNTNKADFNYCNADTALKSAERTNSHQNHILRTRAGNKGLKSYTPVAPCKSCQRLIVLLSQIYVLNVIDVGQEPKQV